MQFEELHPKVAEVRELLKDQVEHRLEGERVGHLEDLLICTLLDPRFKNFDFKRASASMRADAQKWLRGSFQSNFAPRPERDDAKGYQQTKSSQSTMGSTSSSMCLVPGHTVHKATGFLDSDEEEGEEEDISEQPIEVTSVGQVDKYLALPQVPQAPNFDLLLWWKEHAHMFPDLARMARQYLALPATSAGVERVFSASGRFNNNLSKRVKEETLEALLTVHQNS